MPILNLSTHSSKNLNEDILYLNNPLILQNAPTKKNKIELITSSELGINLPLTIANPKLGLKGDKKVKKIEKGENTDTETNNKYKLKKKSRTKLTFDEDLDSTRDYDSTDQETSDNSTNRTLERPPRPEAQKTNNLTTKKKTSTSETEKKPKSINNKKNTKNYVQTEKEIILSSPITLEELSTLSSIPKSVMIKSLFLKGIYLTANKLIDPILTQKLGEEFGIKIIVKTSQDLEITKPTAPSEKYNDLRPPIVTILGHVDHGKTTLLDKIRKTQFAQKETGGITQKIGAYEVSVPYQNQLEKIVFLDTPGHEAFSKMRSRGLSISDIAILVVAADDGLRSQTLEAIEQIQKANIPLIVAINKVDKDTADVENIKKELTRYNVISEEWGGDTLMIPISALQGTNIDKLLESILLLKDVLELQTRLNAPARGIILESNLDKSKGTVASLISREGIIQVGDTIVINNNTTARIRGMMNSKGESVRTITPSLPVIVWGFQKVPSIGSNFLSFTDEKEAKIFVDRNSTKNSNTDLKLIFDNVESNLQSKKQVNLIIKAESQGSLEAITSNLSKLCTPTVQVRILNSSVGEITETDLQFSNITKSSLLVFNTTYSAGIRKEAKNKKINIKEFSIIYDLFDYVQSLIDEKNEPQYEKDLIGLGVVQAVFPLAKSFVAGTSVKKGKILKSSFIHIIRDSEILYKGSIDSLRKIKEDILEASAGSDCGIFINEFGDWKPGDTIEAFNPIS